MIMSGVLKAETLCLYASCSATFTLKLSTDILCLGPFVTLHDAATWYYVGLIILICYLCICYVVFLYCLKGLYYDFKRMENLWIYTCFCYFIFIPVFLQTELSIFTL